MRMAKIGLKRGVSAGRLQVLLGARNAVRGSIWRVVLAR